MWPKTYLVVELNRNNFQHRYRFGSSQHSCVIDQLQARYHYQGHKMRNILNFQYSCYQIEHAPHHRNNLKYFFAFRLKEVMHKFFLKFLKFTFGSLPFGSNSSGAFTSFFSITMCKVIRWAWWTIDSAFCVISPVDGCSGFSACFSVILESITFCTLIKFLISHKLWVIFYELEFLSNYIM